MLEPVYLEPCMAKDTCRCDKCTGMGDVWKDIKNRLDLFNAIRLVTHITDIEQPWLNRTQWNETTNQSERVKYIMNELREEDYKQLLFTRERQYEKNQEVYHIYDTFVNVVTDILRKFIEIHKDNKLVGNSILLSKLLGISCETVTEIYARRANGPKEWWADASNNTVRVRQEGGARSTLERIDKLLVINTEHINDVRVELDKIEKYCNQEFKQIAKLYKLVTPLISISADRIFSQRGN